MSTTKVAEATLDRGKGGGGGNFGPIGPAPFIDRDISSKQSRGGGDGGGLGEGEGTKGGEVGKTTRWRPIDGNGQPSCTACMYVS